MTMEIPIYIVYNDMFHDSATNNGNLMVDGNPHNHNWLIRIAVLTQMSQIFWVVAVLDVFSRLDATMIPEHVIFF